MYNITLICTTHKTIGNCNSEELLKIIELHDPEIIFEEISKAVYKQCYGLQNRYTLETRAIKIYSLYKEIKHIPVVGAELSEDLDKKLEILTKNQDYKYLFYRFLSLERKYGFNFLNSSDCEQILEQLNALEKRIVDESKDEVLKSLIQLSAISVCKYEDEIIKNIYDYSKENKFEKALLFMGAAHRKSMINKLKEYNKTTDLKLNWSFH